MITVKLAGGWTAPCKACGEPVSWRQLPGGGLVKFNADPVTCSVSVVDGVAMQYLRDEDLHEVACDPHRRPRPLFNESGMW